MALTTNQKEVCRLLIQANPDPAYMKALGESDDFALAEIAKVAPALAARAQLQADGNAAAAQEAQATATLLNSVLS